jgi:hypothetical protein
MCEVQQNAAICYCYSIIVAWFSATCKVSNLIPLPLCHFSLPFPLPFSHSFPSTLCSVLVTVLMYQRLIEATTTLQSKVRLCAARTSFVQLRMAAIRLQTLLRSIADRIEFSKTVAAAVSLQTVIRLETNTYICIHLHLSFS